MSHEEFQNLFHMLQMGWPSGTKDKNVTEENQNKLVQIGMQ